MAPTSKKCDGLERRTMRDLVRLSEKELAEMPEIEVGPPVEDDGGDD